MMGRSIASWGIVTASVCPTSCTATLVRWNAGHSTSGSLSSCHSVDEDNGVGGHDNQSMSAHAKKMAVCVDQTVARSRSNVTGS